MDTFNNAKFLKGMLKNMIAEEKGQPLTGKVFAKHILNM